ncbi:FAD-dependent oxidoreductase [Geobacter sp. FeAm09]|uniref:FAD-dependent oxidoreductase n=1 Tax=Geobacter sp. FeAm09 TaxID=2597769 RepID=UPI00143DDEB9|nr:FAD-dependent oxidoreductase [Geobacter sp. FeAm09]
MKISVSFLSKTACLVAVLVATICVNGVFAAEKYSADVVVIGAGGAGLSAALTAAQGGAKVILLEKDKMVGGTGNFAEGVFGVETEMQRLKQIGLTKDHVFNEEMADTRWNANAALVRRFHNESAKTIDWLVAQGVKFEGPSRNHFTNNPTWHLIEGRGAALIRALYARIKENPNVTLLLETPGKSLIVRDGRAVGVKAQNKAGEEVIAEARGGVIIATGGFANSPEMIKKYTGMENVLNVAPLKKTGDGINMAISLGADVEGMNILQFVALMDAVPGGRPDLAIGCMGIEPRNIWVNKFGKRFTNEYVAVDFPFAANAIKRQKLAWGIFDEKQKQRLKETGLEAGLGVVVPPGKKFPNFDEIWDKAIAAGNPFVVKASSLEELAAKTKLPLDALKQTIAEYNKDVAVNKDHAFAKDERYLQAIDANGPLYAVKIKEVLLTTVGGVKVDEYLHPLDKNDNVVVSALYVTGNDVGGMYSGDYTLTSASGSSYGFAVNSGRFAAKSILEELGK